MNHDLQEGMMSFEDLISEGNTLEVDNNEEIISTEETEDTTDSAQDTVEEQEEDATGEESQEELTFEEEGEEEEENIESTTEEPTPRTNTSLTALKKKYLENGKWDDVVLDIDGEEVQLSSLEDIDEETFLQIQEAQDNLREEARADQFIPKEGLNEISLKLIELQKSGGDISEAIQVYDQYVNPLQGLDLQNEKIQEQLVRRSLTKKVDDPEIVEMTIAKYKKDQVLGNKAKEVIDFTNAAFDKYMEQRTAEASDKKRQEQDAHKTYLKSLEEEYKTVEIKSDLKKQILQLANRNDKGELEAVEVVREQLKDPKLAQELLFFISNRDAYKKSIGSKVKTKTNIDNMKRVNIIKDKQKKQTGGSSKPDNGSSDFEFIEVPNL